MALKARIGLYDIESGSFAASRGRVMRWVLAAILLASAILISGCVHVSPLWPLKVETAGAVRYG